MPTRLKHWHNQIARNSATIVASLVVAAVIGALYYKYLAAAAVTFYGGQSPMIIELPTVF